MTNACWQRLLHYLLPGIANRARFEEMKPRRAATKKTTTIFAAALALSSTGNSDEHSNVGQNEHAGSSGLNTPMAISSASKGNVAQLQNELDSLEQREREDALHVEKFRSKMHAYTKSNASYLMSTLAERTSKQWLGILRDLALIQHEESTECRKGNNELWLVPEKKPSRRLVQLRALGFCGADDSVDPQDLREISRAFPAIEWGVLFRPTKRGHLDMRPLSGV